MADWNPQLYLKFKKERTLPVYDLIAKIEQEAPRRILDIGCGPGNSTAALVNRFPGAQVTGLDYSPAMIERAKNECPTASFIVGDAGSDLSGLGSFDLVFANAWLQWMPDHEGLLQRLFVLLNQGGAMAIQIPQFDRMPIDYVIDKVAASPDFADFFAGFESGMHFLPDGAYYDVLSISSSDVYMWATEYFHVMEDHSAIIEWISSTGMKPYIERLPEELRGAFISKVLEEIKMVYPSQKDGRVLFPFKRLFFISYKTD